jgi:hypothetical protein
VSHSACLELRAVVASWELATGNWELATGKATA